MDLAVQVGGHTDNVPVKKGISEFKTNWGLSAARSIAVVEYWIKKFNIPSEKLSAKAFADSQPLTTNATPEGRATNRRVEFRIRPAHPQVVITGIELVDKPVETDSPLSQ
jgi:chemotaxis protein MotB